MHQEPQPAHQLIALAVVIESSLAVAQEWPFPIFQYCMNLFKRINDAHHPAKLRAAFVGYATIDTVPSPILCKRFFTENTMVFREIYEEPMHFGIGTTNSGGAHGMAALEGLVAALEMFDDLQKLQNTKICSSYIIHIAASAPDNSPRPEWNDSELMDDMSWESLPVELKKRNIAYNLLTLRPPQGRLAELYAAMNTNADTPSPWFELRSSFTLSAASIVSLQPVKAATKRQNEVPPPTEQPPENKRLRLQANPQLSPKPIAKAAPPPPAQPSPSPEPPLPVQPPEPEHLAQTQPQPYPQAPSRLQQTETQPAPPSTQPAAHPLLQNVPLQQYLGNLSLEELTQRLFNATEMMHKHELAIQSLIASGDMERAQLAKAEYDKRKPQYEKLRLFVQKYKEVLLKRNSAQSSNGIGAPQFPVGGNNMPPGNQNPAMPPQPVANPGLTQPQNLQAIDVHPSNTNFSMNPAMPSVMNNSMQKPMEQQLQHHPNAPSVGMQNTNTANAPFAVGGESTPGMGAMPSGPHLVTRPAVEWRGTLKCNGQGPNGMREVQCAVVGSPLASERAHTATWPKTMELMPVDKIPMIQLQDWIRKQQSCLCSFKPLTEVDQASYNMLMHVLETTHAVASWTVPSGSRPTRNAILFTYHQRTSNIIGAAIFPLTGIPDSLPKGIPQQMGAPHLMQAFQAMSHAEKQQFMSQYLMRQNMMRQQQQAQAAQLASQQNAGISSFNPNIQVNMGSGLNPMGVGPPQGNFTMNRNSQTHGLPATMTAGSLGGTMPMNPAPSGGNMNYEAMQALMQRNGGIGMNMGQNMG